MGGWGACCEGIFGGCVFTPDTFVVHDGYTMATPQNHESFTPPTLWEGAGFRFPRFRSVFAATLFFPTLEGRVLQPLPST